MMENKILLFLKGFLMGICDLIPGISGGTIAFITGIYSRLIASVKNISPKLVYDFFKYLANRKKENLKILKKDIKKVDLFFLVILLLGIGTALLAGSRVIKFLLDNYFLYTLSFFVGLVLSSSKIIFDNIKNHKIKNIMFGIVGFIFGVLFLILVPLTVTPSLYYVFIGGFFAVSAMFLPGISGAFILLILGLYEFMINVMHNMIESVEYLLIFIAGALLGAFTISRVITFLFKKDKCKTLYFLLGLVIGSLSIPLRKISQIPSLGALNVSIMLFFAALGILLVIIINSFVSSKR